MLGTVLEKLIAGVLCSMTLAGLPGCGAEIKPLPDKPAPPDAITVGTQTQRGFVNDNVYHSELGDIHYSSYIPDSYDGSRPYALFITLPGWEGLYFQGVGDNMGEDFGPESIQYNDKMIVLSPQLDDWGETSAQHTIALTEYFLAHYNIDPGKVYLHGMSGGGETGSLVMGTKPELYAAYLMTSSKWDGNLEVLAAAKTPVYLAIGEDDSYYGSGPLKNTYAQLRELYGQEGLTQNEIDRLVVLDVKPGSYFTEQGYQDQHAGGQAFAHDEEIMGWLFGAHGVKTIPEELKYVPEGYAHDGTAANEYMYNALRFFWSSLHD